MGGGGGPMGLGLGSPAAEGPWAQGPRTAATMAAEEFLAGSGSGGPYPITPGDQISCSGTSPHSDNYKSNWINVLARFIYPFRLLIPSRHWWAQGPSLHKRC